MNMSNHHLFAVLVGIGPAAVISASRLAREVGVSASTINQLRYGKLTRVRPEVAKKIEAALPVEEGALFVEEKESVPA